MARRSLFPFMVFVLFAALPLDLGLAQQTPAKAPEPAAKETKSAPSEKPRLPADSTAEYTLNVEGRSLSFKATAGSLRLADDNGAPQAEIAYVAYQLDGVDAAKRPVTFAINGGPGAGSAWLQLGALGPWRLPMKDLSPSSPPVLVDNAETWLDFTDLVFIDPPGTGYSKIVAPGEEAKKKLWSVDGDVDALSVVIRRWLVANQRLDVAEVHRRRELRRLSRPPPGEKSRHGPGRRRQRPDPDFAGAGFRRLCRRPERALHAAHAPALLCGGLSRKEGPGDARRSRRRRAIRGRRLFAGLAARPARSRGGGTDGAARRGADGHGPANRAAARRPHRQGRIPARIRARAGQGARLLRRLHRRLRPVPDRLPEPFSRPRRRRVSTARFRAPSRTSTSASWVGRSRIATSC